ncbi:DUF6574 domain-containing protein [Halobacillus faecis]
MNQSNHQPSTQALQPLAASVTAPAPQNEYVERAKNTSRQFYQFAIQSLKKPFSTCKEVNDGQKVNGLISLALFAFLFPLFSYFVTRNVSRGVGSFTGVNPDIPFGSFVIQPFFYALLFFAVFVAVHLGVGKMMKVETNYLSVLAKYGSLLVLPITGLLIANLFALLSLSAVATFFFFISLALFTAASFSLLFTLNAEKTSDSGLDVFYGLVITNIVMVIFYFIVGVSIFNQIIRDLQSGPLGFFM